MAEKKKKRSSSSTQLRTKFKIEALTFELSHLRKENEFLKATLDRIQSNKHTGGDVLLEEHLRELHLGKDVPQTVLISDDSDRMDTDLSQSDRSTGRKQFNYCKTKEEEELELDYHQIFS